MDTFQQQQTDLHATLKKQNARVSNGLLGPKRHQHAEDALMFFQAVPRTQCARPVSRDKSCDPNVPPWLPNQTSRHVHAAPSDISVRKQTFPLLHDALIRPGSNILCICFNLLVHQMGGAYCIRTTVIMLGKMTITEKSKIKSQSQSCDCWKSSLDRTIWPPHPAGI